MNENPYQAPASGGEAYGVLSGRREDVRSVAVYQKGILVCILLNLLLFMCRAGVAESMRIYIFIPYVLIGIAGLVYVVLLAMKVYGTGLGILLGILVLVPFVNLIVLLVVSSKATSILQRNGYKVGLMGANLSDIP